MSDVREALGKARVMFWTCIREGHRHVEWDGDLARCAEPGCGITSDDTAPWLRDLADAIQKAEDNQREFLLAELERLESIINRTILATGDPYLRADDLPAAVIQMRFAAGPGARVDDEVGGDMFTASDLHEALIVADLDDDLDPMPGFTVLSGGEPQTKARDDFGVFEAELTEAGKGPAGETTRFRVTIERLED